MKFSKTISVLLEICVIYTHTHTHTYIHMMLTLKPEVQYFGHLMQRADSLEKTLTLGKIEEDEMVR